MCARRLSCLQIWETCTPLKSFSLISSILLTILRIVIGGSHSPFTALSTIYESHSKITSRTLTSHAKRTPPPKLLLQSPMAPTGMVYFYLASPRLFQQNHGLLPQLPKNEWIWKLTPSTLSLYEGTFGRDHGASSLDPLVLSLMLAIWNSSRRNRARCKISDPCYLVFPSRASFLLNHMHHATMTTNSNSSLSVTPWLPTIFVESTLQQNLFLQTKQNPSITW